MRLANRSNSALFGLALLIAPCTAEAQGRWQRLIINVPFAYDAGTAHLPSGRYDLRFISPQVLSLGDGKVNGMAFTNLEVSNHAADDGLAVFHCYQGRRCFLREVHYPGSANYVSLPQLSSEKQAKREAEVASAKEPVSVVEIALAVAPK